MNWQWVNSELPSRDASVLRHVLEARAALVPDKIFVRFDDGNSWTYAQTLRHARRTAVGLSSLGVGVGDVVFALLPNGPEFLKTWFGTNLLGAALAAPNIAARGAALQHVLSLSNARVGVTDPAYIERLRGLELGTIRMMLVTGAVASESPIACMSLDSLLDAADPDTAPDVIVEPWQTQFILFTSGTTGPSKGAIVTYVQMHDMVMSTFGGRLGEDDNYLINMPLFHIGGSRAVQGMLMLGGSIALIPNFRTETFWETARRHNATACVLLGSTARFLEQQAPRPDDANNPLRLVAMVPMVRDPQAFSRRFGVDVTTSYGMSELSIPIVSHINPTNPDSCGKLRPGYIARIVDEFDREVPEGQQGELILRADRPWTISPGYWRMPEATADVWRNGWFHTGDRFKRNADGEYFFIDRQKDAIRRRGENISSFEAEAEILSHPRVSDAAVVGVPSPHGEHDLLAVVVLSEGSSLDPAVLLEYLRGRMAHFMVPRYIRYVKDMPRTPSTRVQKHLLRAEGVTTDTWDREAAGIVIKRDVP